MGRAAAAEGRRLAPARRLAAAAAGGLLLATGRDARREVRIAGMGARRSASSCSRS
jgi:hypothetical protein